MKRAISIFLCIVICITAIPTSVLAANQRDTSFERTLAAGLKQLGLFQGISDTDFDLNRKPSRAEAIVMLIRVLGKEAEALNGTYTHPFTDVAAWAAPYVGYAYQKGLTNGVSDTAFGTDEATAEMYLTFVLRALGYSDANGADFVWNRPFDLARRVGILPACVDTEDFWRADVVVISYAALPVCLKGSAQTLAQKLIAAGVFAQSVYDACYDAAAIDRHCAVKPELTAEQIYAQCSRAVFYIETYDAQGVVTGSGSGFFIDSNGTAVTNYHVIDNAVSAKAIGSVSGNAYKILGVYDYSESEDWAVIKVEGSGFAYLSFGDPASVVGGATVYAIGSPLGLQNTISQGLISNPSRTEDGVAYIQTSAAISHGSSGGALINKYGEVIGITSASYVDGQNLNLALPVSVINGFDRSSLTALSVLNPPSTPVQRQQAAFDALKAWILQNYNTLSIDDKAYQETYTYSSGTDQYMVYYSEEFDSITLTYYCTLNGMRMSLYTELTHTGQNFLSMFFYYAAENTSSYADFEGTGYIYAPLFQADSFIFDQCEGNTYNLSTYQSYAAFMQGEILNFTEYIFSSHLSGLYSITDFGFPNSSW